MTLAFNLSAAVQEWHAAGSWADRVKKGICIGRTQLRFQDDHPKVMEQLLEEQVKLETEEGAEFPQPKTSLLEVDYGSDDDDDDDESVVDQQNILDALEPALLIQDALDAAQDDGNWAVMQDVQPKAEDVENSVLAGDSNTSILADKHNMMDIDVAAPDIPTLKASSSDPILGPNSASRNNDVELPPAQAKLSSKANIYAPVRERIAYSNDDKLILGPDDFHNLVDDTLLPPSDLSTIFPDLQPLSLFDVPSVIVPSINEGKKRSEKRLERDDPSRRSEDTTYTKLFPCGEFMYSKPTLLGPLQPSKYFKDGRWVMEDSAVFPDSENSTRISENTLSGKYSLVVCNLHDLLMLLGRTV